MLDKTDSPPPLSVLFPTYAIQPFHYIIFTKPAIALGKLAVLWDNINEISELHNMFQLVSERVEIEATTALFIGMKDKV